MIIESLMCLALNVYHEARNQSLAGQVAVAQVTLNRVMDRRYPDTICGVVRQAITFDNGQPVRNQCQFSWYCDGKSDKPRNQGAWYTAYNLAERVMRGDMVDITEGSTHYHADYLVPEWANTKTYVTQIDDHIFYRWEK